MRRRRRLEHPPQDIVPLLFVLLRILVFVVGHKSKTRFVMNADGKDHELFAVRERGDKSLILMPSHDRFLENRFMGPNSDLQAVREQHYSVHKTNGGIDTELTQKTLLTNGTSISNAAFIHDTSEKLLYPIYARRPSLRDDDRQAFKAHPKDTVIRIGSYRTDSANLLFSVFVSKGYPAFPIEPGSMFSIFTEKFTEFEINVVVTYVNLPTHPRGDVRGLMTSPTVFNGERGLDHFHLDALSMVPDQAIYSNLLLLDGLRCDLLARALAEVPQGGSVEILLALADIFTRAPIINLEEARD